ncbi:MAG TPA: hypothetical protein VGS61_06315 [Acidimicrobiales bacterium]|nr:hypothetical protein [Acidimicrobiales bacterium]
MSSDERASVTRRALIDATAQRLEAADESELRIADVCADTGYSSSVIYSNFRSRQGLVDAALLDLFDRYSRAYTDLVDEYTRDARSLDEMLAFYTDPAQHERLAATLAGFRQVRLRVSTAAILRPELRREWRVVYADYVGRMAAMVERGQDAGFIGRRLSAHELAVLLEAMAYGRALDGISLDPLPDLSWLTMLELVFRMVDDGLAARPEDHDVGASAPRAAHPAD